MVVESNIKKGYNHIPVVPGTNVPLDDVMNDIRGLDKECFRVVKVNEDNTFETIFEKLGNEYNVEIPFKEVVKQLTLHDVERFLFVHNHPNNEVEPSEDDMILATDFSTMAKILRIKMVDFMIVSKDYTYSRFQDEKNIKKDKLFRKNNLSINTYFALKNENEHLADLLNMVMSSTSLDE